MMDHRMIHAYEKDIAAFTRPITPTHRPHGVRERKEFYVYAIEEGAGL